MSIPRTITQLHTTPEEYALSFESATALANELSANIVYKLYDHTVYKWVSMYYTAIPAKEKDKWLVTNKYDPRVVNENTN